MKIKICLVSLLLALVTVTLDSPRTEAQVINVSFPDTVGAVGDTLEIPIFVDDLTGREVLSFGLKVYNIFGQEIATLFNDEQTAGYKKVTWDASSFTSGIYFYRLQAEDFVQTRKMVLLK